MEKTLIAVALAALPMVSMAADGDGVVVYGNLSAGWEGDKTTRLPTQVRVDDYNSYIGFKGGEALGNGINAIWQIESHFHIDGTRRAPGNGDTPNTFGSRETFIGVNGAFGKVRLGNLNNAIQDLSSVDPWTYGIDGMSVIDDNGNVARSRGVNGLAAYSVNAGRLKNALRYDSPDLYGFSGHVEYGFGENASSGSRASDAVSLGLNYTNSGFFGHYAYQQEFNPLGVNVNGVLAAQSDTTRNTAYINRLEFGYDANNLLVALGYQRAKGYDWADFMSGDAGFSGNNMAQFMSPGSVAFLSSAQRQLVSKQAALTVAYTYGAFTPRASYAKGWNQSDNFLGTIGNSGYQQYVLGVDYALSKRTSTGVSYGNLKWGQNTSQTLQRATVGNPLPGNTTVQTWGVHLTHKF